MLGVIQLRNRITLNWRHVCACRGVGSKEELEIKMWLRGQDSAMKDSLEHTNATVRSFTSKAPMINGLIEWAHKFPGDHVH